MVDIKNLSKIGIGTWGIGGFAQKDLSIDLNKQKEALIFSLNNGMNWAELNYWTAEGAAVQLFKNALSESSVNRNEIFIHQMIYHYSNPTFDKAKSEVYKLLEDFNTDYIDSVGFNPGSFKEYGLDNIVKFLKVIVKQKITRYISVTNLDKNTLQFFINDFKDLLYAHEISYSFEVRENEKLDLTKVAQDNSILNICTQPLRRNRTALRNWDILVDLANKYSVTQNQILLNWIARKGFYSLVKSSTIKNIQENLDAFRFEISVEDFDLIDNFELPNYVSPKIDWELTGEGVRIDQLANVFDEEFDKQLLSK
jgi:diketogulonate reductase-like aldo/keto reductase